MRKESSAGADHRREEQRHERWLGRREGLRVRVRGWRVVYMEEKRRGLDG